MKRLIPAVLALASWAAAPAPSYRALDCGALVPIPAGYRAVSRHQELDPDAEVAVLFKSGGPEAALRAEKPSDGRILVEVSPLRGAELKDPAGFFSRLEERLRAEARSRPGKVAVRALKGLPHRALYYRSSGPDLARVYLLAPGRLVTVSSEFWAKAVAEVAKGYRDAP